MSENDQQRLSLTALQSFLLKISGAALGLLLQLFLSRVLNTEQFGLFIVGLTFVVSLMTFASLGFPFAASRFVPVYLGRKEESLVRGFVISARGASWLGSVLVLLVALPLIWWWPSMEPGLKATLLIACFCIPLFCATQVETSLLVALEHIPRSEIVASIIRPFMTITVIGLLLMMEWQPIVATTVMWVTGIAAFFSLTYGVWYAGKALRVRLTESIASYRLREWFGAGFAMLFVISGVVFNERIDIFFVAGLAGIEDAGIYGVCARLAFIVGFAMAAVNALLGPMMGVAFAVSDNARLNELAHFGAWLGTTAALLVGVPVILGNELLLSLFGADFIAGADALTVLVWSQISIALFGGTGAVVILHDGYRIAIISVVFGMVLNVVLNMALIPRMGMVGASWATLAAMVGSHLVILVWCIVHTRINPSITGGIPQIRMLADRSSL
ncbi:MAG: polysaccharide biosynthesis C-terminal domain-containing protein [Pseudomonadota bacterium]